MSSREQTLRKRHDVLRKGLLREMERRGPHSFDIGKREAKLNQSVQRITRELLQIHKSK